MTCITSHTTPKLRILLKTSSNPGLGIFPAPSMILKHFTTHTILLKSISTRYQGPNSTSISPNKASSEHAISSERMSHDIACAFTRCHLTNRGTGALHVILVSVLHYSRGTSGCNKNNGLIWSLVKFNWKYILAAVVFKLVNDILTFTGPQILKKLIYYNGIKQLE